LDGQFDHSLQHRRNGDAASRGQDNATCNQDLIGGYTELIEQRVQHGYRPYLITFMFNQLPGSPSAVIKQMQDEVERVYATLVTRVVRKPRSPQSADRLPVFVGFADLPVAKREKKQLQEVALNGGLHYHGILLMPAQSRLRTGLPFHFMKYRRLYLRDRSRLDRLHVRPIDTDTGYVMRYALKALENGRLPYDNCILVLPKSITELPRADPGDQVRSAAESHRS
jgi:hypothetical protein